MGKKKDKKKSNFNKPEIMYQDAPDERDVNTTAGLLVKSVNMMLSRGIKDSLGKDGDPNIDINPKAIEAALKVCNTFNAQIKQSKDLEDLDRMMMSDIVKDQRKRLNS